MKMKSTDFETLKKFINNTVNNFEVDIEKEYEKSRLSKLRFRWDMFYLSGIKIGDGIGIPDGDIIDSELNMDHIDTALRKIFGHKKGDK